MLHATHEVLNQVPPLDGGYNLFQEDIPLREAHARSHGAWATAMLTAHGERVGGDAFRWGVLANTNPPTLRTHDRRGYRVDDIEYHPAWHDLMRLAVNHELHGLPWRAPRAGAHATRAALFYLQSQAEAGHGCPISMTYAIIPALRTQPEIAAELEPKLTSPEYDTRPIPLAQKRGGLAGMAMTEKQGGSDVRANTTRAVALGRSGPGEAYALTGHKWFCSSPLCDVFLMLAHTDKGLSCFAVPRWRDDGSRNHIFIQRLKDKLGNRSNASSEIELDAAWGRMIGEDGRGVATIIEMVNHTRLDCVIGAAAGVRQATVQAIHHACHRSAFGRPLIAQPLMRNVLADLAIESEAATLLMMRLARAYDESAESDTARAFARLATAVAKYWVCRRNPAVCVEALEALGGAGYVEESLLPRLYREAPLNAIWEGSGNVICLDVLRAIGRTPESLDAVIDEIEAAGDDQRLRAAVTSIRAELADPADIEVRARRIVERIALALQASLLLRQSSHAVADAFCATRLAGDAGRALGTLPRGTEFSEIIGRAWAAAN